MVVPLAPESGKICTGQIILQPISFKSDRLLGIAVFPQDHQKAGGLMKRADAAMYMAKEAGRNSFRFFRT